MANFTALKTAINNAIKTNGNEEITGAILQAILDAMVETLGDSAINDLENAITTEVINRENAVGGVADDLAAEALARANKDNQLDGRINQEEYNRANADAALSRTVDQGFQTLNSQMTALNAAISALNAAYQNGYLYGGIATPSSSPSNNKCFYIALQGGTYTNFGGVGVVKGINILKNDNGWKVEHIYDQTTLLNEFYLLRQQVIQAITSFAPIVIEGDVTNAPDEEDLTSNANHLLQFKNNAYNPLDFSGLGRKYLRKNIAPLSESAAFNGFVEGVTAEETLSGTPEYIFWDRMNTRFMGIKDGMYYADWSNSDNYIPASTSLVYMYQGTPYRWDGSDFSVDETEVPNLVNCLTQDMINEANTIYIIRYDYILKENITIPAGCVLQFDGGSINGGSHTITFTKTYLSFIDNNVGFSDCIFAGTIVNKELYVNNMGASTSLADNFAVLDNIFDLSYLDAITFIFGEGAYHISSTLEIWSGYNTNSTIKGAGKRLSTIVQDTDNIPVLITHEYTNVCDIGLGFASYQADTNTKAIGLAISRNIFNNIERVFFFNVGTAIGLIDNTDCRKHTINDHALVNTAIRDILVLGSSRYFFDLKTPSGVEGVTSGCAWDNIYYHPTAEGVTPSTTFKAFMRLTTNSNMGDIGAVNIEGGVCNGSLFVGNFYQSKIDISTLHIEGVEFKSDLFYVNSGLLKINILDIDFRCKFSFPDYSGIFRLNNGACVEISYLEINSDLSVDNSLHWYLYISNNLVSNLIIKKYVKYATNKGIYELFKRDNQENYTIAFINGESINYGSSSRRPTLPKNGTLEYFDTSVKKPIWWAQKDWIDANGGVYLLRNLVDGVNTLTQDMFYTGEVGSRVPNANTTFIIQYNFVLGENITIPDNCVLQFVGGSIDGDSHTITFSNTRLSFKDNSAAFTNCVFAGTIANNEILVDNFGASPSNANNFAVLDNIFDLTANEPITFLFGEGSYHIASTLEIYNSMATIKGLTRGSSKIVQDTDNTPVLIAHRAVDINNIGLGFASYQEQSNTKAIGLALGYYSSGNVERVRFDNASIAIGLIDNAYCRKRTETNHAIINCAFKDILVYGSSRYFLCLRTPDSTDGYTRGCSFDEINYNPTVQNAATASTFLGLMRLTNTSELGLIGTISILRGICKNYVFDGNYQLGKIDISTLRMEAVEFQKDVFYVNQGILKIAILLLADSCKLSGDYTGIFRLNSNASVDVGYLEINSGFSVESGIHWYLYIANDGISELNIARYIKFASVGTFTLFRRDTAAQFCLATINGMSYNYSTTSLRPTLPSGTKMVQLLDVTLGKPIWWIGTGWIDSTGATV